jgi:putative ABC transport system substrate-binding protein
MRRRQIIGLIAGAAIGLPFAARGQQAGKVRLVGMIATSGSTAIAAGPTPPAPPAAALLQGLRDLGYVYGRDFVTEARGAEGKLERIPAIIAELAERKVDVIVAPGPALADLKEARIAIPVVMSGAGSDPVQAGLIASLAHPGGNFTGLSLLNADLDAKRLELLTEILPGASRLAVLRGPNSEQGWQETEAAGRSLQRELLLLDIKAPSEIEAAFGAAAAWRAEALLVMAGALLDQHAREVVDHAAALRLPAVYSFRSFFMEAGGLASYGVDLVAVWRRAAYYVDKILRGVPPGELPVEQPTKFELVINLRSAKQLGLAIPPSVLARADEVIE